MPKATVRSKEEQVVVEWLNSTCGQKVREIHKNLMDLDDYLANKRFYNARKTHKSLTELLSEYKFTITLALNSNDGITIHSRPISPGIEQSELIAVQTLIRLYSDHELLKIKLCEKCLKNWCLSNRNMDRFCSQGCREDSYKKDPSFRERNARNQRRYRENRAPTQSAP